MGLVTTAVISAAVQAVPAGRAGLASSINNTARLTAGAFGVAISALPLDPHRPGALPHGLHTVDPATALIWLAALLLTHTSIPKSDTPAHNHETNTRACG